MAFFDEMPSWLRWILFLPLALIASLFTFLIMGWVSIQIAALTSRIEPRVGLFFGALAHGFTGFVLVWVGAWTAPKAKFFSSIILVGLFCLPAGYILMKDFSGADREGFYWTVILMSAGLIGAVAACNSVYKNYR